MNYHDYIWDLGGTLLDNYESSTRAFVETLKEFGYQADHDSVYQKLKESTADAIAYFIPEEADFLKEYKANEAKVLETPILFQGAKELLAKIQRQGSRNFLVSHRDNQVIVILEKTEIIDYFTEVVTAYNGFSRKPSPESMLYLKEKYQIDNCLVIGDRDIDKQAGESAGFDTLLVDGSKSLMEIIE
ncbi:DNA gyrase subunit B [Streptococcus agalactiae]|nr:DNA gyrase subunit B [Streptococcus agalactiae]